MGLMLIVGIAWMVLAVVVAMMIGRAIRAADARAVTRRDAPKVPPRPEAQVLTLQLSRGRTLA